MPPFGPLLAPGSGAIYRTGEAAGNEKAPAAMSLGVAL